MSHPNSRYYYLKSMSELRSERALLKIHSKMKEDNIRLKWNTTKEFVSWSNIKALVDEKLEPLRNIAGIASATVSTIISLVANRHKRDR